MEGITTETPGACVQMSRRELLRQAAMASALAAGWGMVSGRAFAQKGPRVRPLRFVQLSDTHIGYQGEANRDIPGTLHRALDVIRSLDPAPEFVVVTGDLTQAAESEAARLERFRMFREQMDTLHLPVYPVPGEHDALMDQGQLYQKAVGPLHYRFERAGVQFFALDNVSRGFFVGGAQRQWISREIARADPLAPTVLLTHAPLYDLFVPWNWYTYDAKEVLALFSRFRRLMVLFGHVHQLAGQHGPSVSQSAGLSTAWPLPEPDALARLEKWPQSASDPDMGLGLRVIDVASSGQMAVSNLLLSHEKKEEAAL